MGMAVQSEGPFPRQELMLDQDIDWIRSSSIQYLASRICGKFMLGLNKWKDQIYELGLTQKGIIAAYLFCLLDIERDKRDSGIDFAVVLEEQKIYVSLSVGI